MVTTESDVIGTARDSTGDGTVPEFATGVYIVSLTKIENAGRSQFPIKNQDGSLKTDASGNAIYPDQLKWYFDVSEVDSRRATEAQTACVGKSVHRWTSTSFGMGPNGPSKARGYYEALIGRRMAEGEQARISAVLHQQARATIKAEAGKITGFDLTPIDEMVETPV